MQKLAYSINLSKTGTFTHSSCLINFYTQKLFKYKRKQLHKQFSLDTDLTPLEKPDPVQKPTESEEDISNPDTITPSTNTNFKINIDYFTLLLIVGIISSVLGVTSSFQNTKSFDFLLSPDYYLNTQLPIQTVIFIAIFLQAVAGWGFALISISGIVSLNLDISIKDAQALIALIAILVDSSMFWPYRNTSYLKKDIIDKWLIGALIGTPLGVLLLRIVDEKLANTSLSFIILLYCFYSAYNIIKCYYIPNSSNDDSCKIAPNEYNRYSVWLSGLFAGILGGMFDAPGPALVVFADLTGMANNSNILKANFLAYFAIDSQIVALSDVVDNRFALPAIWPTLVLALPVLYVANGTGKAFSRFVDQDKFRWLVIALLAFYAISKLN